MSGRILTKQRSLLKETLYVSFLFFSVFLLFSLLGMPGRVEQILRNFFFQYFSYASLIFPTALLWLFRPYRTSRSFEPSRAPQGDSESLQMATLAIEPLRGSMALSGPQIDSEGLVSPDLLFDAAVAFAEQVGAVGIKSLRKRFGIGHSRAKKIFDEMENRGLLTNKTDEVGRRILAALPLQSAPYTARSG